MTDQRWLRKSKKECESNNFAAVQVTEKWRSLIITSPWFSYERSLQITRALAPQDVCMYHRVHTGWAVGAAIRSFKEERKREQGGARARVGAGPGAQDWMAMEHESASHIRRRDLIFRRATFSSNLFLRTCVAAIRTRHSPLFFPFPSFTVVVSRETLATRRSQRSELGDDSDCDFQDCGMIFHSRRIIVHRRDLTI